METMTLTRLEKEQNFKLCELSASIATLQEVLKHERETTKQLRDELAAVKAELEKQYSNLAGEINSKCDEVLKLKDRADRAERELGAATNANRNAIAENVRLTKERDEALAKVKQPEQPRMVMRDGGQFYEVTLKPNGLPVWDVWIDERNTTVFRRPITADELRTWLPVEQQQPGEVLFDGVRWIASEMFDIDKTLRMEQSGIATIPVHVTIRKAGE